MGKHIVHIPPGGDFFDGGAKQTAAMKNFGFKGSLQKPSSAPMQKAAGGRVDPDIAQDKAMIKKGIRQHETQEHGGRHADIELRRGGAMPKGIGALRSALKAKSPKRAMRKPSMMPAAPMASDAPPAPDFSDNGVPPGLTAMRRGGKVCR